MGWKPKWLNFGYLGLQVIMCRFLRLRARYLRISSDKNS
ncbi:hypothetical protein LCAZH_2946 [Lacticaseibacillus paracasei]|uniref:Uncharacterized protein n=1 Tax=Lacticaseibacillus paracasei subsp. paracasei TaxID=47714 RepID=A0AAP9HHA3_LACPA|nr:hypothetical protein LCAZH_2946 [Lacticaseibacillus paracasei]QGV18131.1 Hypothetical protein LCAKO_1606 [Lacticaseibacillus paracasei subsp. paracasei]